MNSFKESTRYLILKYQDRTGFVTRPVLILHTLYSILFSNSS